MISINKIKKNDSWQLKAGQEVLFSGSFFTARDQVHKKLTKLKNWPFDPRGQVVYYCGPTATPKGKIIGACGPTTSSRMDNFVQALLVRGLAGMVGKGRRSKEVRRLIKKFKAVYFVAPAGCGALLAKKVVSKKLVAFKELGPEAIYELEVKDFPLMVAIDSHGRSIYGDL